MGRQVGLGLGLGAPPCEIWQGKTARAWRVRAPSRDATLTARVREGPGPAGPGPRGYTRNSKLRWEKGTHAA